MHIEDAAFVRISKSVMHILHSVFIDSLDGDVTHIIDAVFIHRSYAALMNILDPVFIHIYIYAYI